MVKLGKLIINEYVKVYMKISTKIMLIVILLVAFGYTGLMYISDRISSNNNYDYYYHEDYDSMIDAARKSEYEGWERDVEIYTYLRDNDITNSWEDADYWRNTAVYYMFDLKATVSDLPENDTEREKLQKQIDVIEKTVKEKDWKGYYNIKVENAKQNKDSVNNDLHESYLDIEIWSYQYRLDNDIVPDNNEWKSNLLNEIEDQKRGLLDLKNRSAEEQDKKEISKYENNILIGTYRLDNDIEVYTSEQSSGLTTYYYENFNYWTVFVNSTTGIGIINVLIIVIAGSAISTEFSSGTVKFLLINPVKRWKIFISKYISIISTAIIMLVIYYIFNVLTTGLLFGFKDAAAPYLYTSGNNVLEGSSFLFVAWKYLIGSVGMICMATFAFAISSLVRNSALSIGLGVFLMLAGSTVVTILKSILKFDWARFILFANTDLNSIINGESLFKEHTVSFALITIGVYMFVFLLTAWDGFVRRDIK